MRVIDAHCHAHPRWFEPVESLLFQMDRYGVEKAVLIQTQATYNNDYQFDCVRRFPDRLSSVPRLDAGSPSAEDDLARFAEKGAAGVRLEPEVRSPGPDPLAIWRAAERLGLPVSCVGNVRSFGDDSFAELIAALPGLTIIVEHLGAFNVPEGEIEPYPMRRKVFALSRFPNVCLKVHGLGEFTPRVVPFDDSAPFGGAVPPLMRMAYEAFGANRLMWGSDYPPVSSREGYGNALNFTREHLADLPPADLDQIFAGTAARVFGLQ